MGVTKVMSCIWVSEAQWKCGRSRPALIPLCPTQFFHNICPTQSFHNICPAQFFHTKWTFHKNCSVQCHNSHSGSSLQYQCNKTKLRISIQVTHFNTTQHNSCNKPPIKHKSPCCSVPTSKIFWWPLDRRAALYRYYMHCMCVCT